MDEEHEGRCQSPIRRSYASSSPTIGYVKAQYPPGKPSVQTTLHYTVVSREVFLHVRAVLLNFPLIRNPPKAFHTRGAVTFEGNHGLPALSATNYCTRWEGNTRIRYEASHVLNCFANRSSVRCGSDATHGPILRISRLYPYRACSSNWPCSLSHRFDLSVFAICAFTMFQNRGVWFASMRCASSCTMT